MNPKSRQKVCREDYEKEFKPSVFLKYYETKSDCELSPFVRFRLQRLHESFVAIPEGVKVLDYGSGPVVVSAISAASKASDIVFADYVENNLKFVRQWLDSEPDAFDWWPYFTHVVQELEGKGKEEARERQELVRKVGKIAHCDINQDPPIQRGFDDQYDVLIVSLVLEGTSRSLEEYRAGLSRLAKLVKPGGTILYYGVENNYGYYTVGDRSFPAVTVNDEMTLSAFADAGFSDVTVTPAPVVDPEVSFRFVTGRRCGDR